MNMNNNFLQNNGNKYGYPKCCVKSFIKLFKKKNKKTDLQKVVIILTRNFGFIPCENCCQDICNGKYKFLSELFIDRQVNIKEIPLRRVSEMEKNKLIRLFNLQIASKNKKHYSTVK